MAKAPELLAQPPVIESRRSRRQASGVPACAGPSELTIPIPLMTGAN
jgi:hypothetical protein